jgi:hypothetical protein
MKRNLRDGEELLIGPRTKVSPWTWVIAILILVAIWSWTPGVWTSPAQRYNKFSSPPFGGDIKAPSVKDPPNRTPE